MKFYLIEISTGDAKIAGKAVYEYETKNEAVAGFHQKLGIAMKSELYTTEMVMVTDYSGNVITKEYFTRNEDELR